MKFAKTKLPLVLALTLIAIASISAVHKHQPKPQPNQINPDIILQQPCRIFQLNPYAKLGEWIELQTNNTKLQLNIDAAAQTIAQQPVYMLAGAELEKLPKRYFLSWLFYLFDLRGHIDGSILFITTSGTQDKRFNCCLETDGPWHKQLKKILKQKLTIKKQAWRSDQLLSFLALRARLPIIIDRTLMPDTGNTFPPPLSRTITTSFDNTPLSEILTTTLNQGGLTYRPQGGVIFVYKSEPPPTHLQQTKRK
jgi:hypothetical protein